MIDACGAAAVSAQRVFRDQVVSDTKKRWKAKAKVHPARVVDRRKVGDARSVLHLAPSVCFLHVDRRKASRKCYNLCPTCSQPHGAAADFVGAAEAACAYYK